MLSKRNLPSSCLPRRLISSLIRHHPASSSTSWTKMPISIQHYLVSSGVICNLYALVFFTDCITSCNTICTDTNLYNTDWGYLLFKWKMTGETLFFLPAEDQWHYSSKNALHRPWQYHLAVIQGLLSVKVLFIYKIILYATMYIS